MPIPGRVLVSAGILDSIAPDKTAHPQSRSKFGIIDYLSTHHYYLWSPLEKTIIVPMAALGLTYAEMLSYTSGLLIITLTYVFGYIFIKLREDDIHLKLSVERSHKKVQFPLAYINWGLLAVIAIVIFLSGIAKSYNSEIKNFIESYSFLNMTTVNGFITISSIAFMASLVMGSSGKYAGIVALLATIYGLEYLTWFIAVEYVGYLISPMHKCLHIGRMYFSTPWKMYAQTLGGWCVLMLGYAAFTV